MLAITSRLENSVRGEDRLALRVDDNSLIVVVADGAGGRGAGAAAAQTVCDAVLALPPGPESWENVFFAVDRLLLRSTAGGLAAAVVVEIVNSVIRGASVGDACAWLVESFQITDLTVNQRRKPLLGSGDADPIAFGPMPFRGRLLVASDGLVTYARRSSSSAAPSSDRWSRAPRRCSRRRAWAPVAFRTTSPSRWRRTSAGAARAWNRVSRVRVNISLAGVGICARELPAPMTKAGRWETHLRSVPDAGRIFKLHSAGEMASLLRLR